MVSVMDCAIAVLLCLSVVSCSARADCLPVTPESSGPIPPCILEKSDQIVISRLGETYFRERCAYDPVLSSYNEAEPMCVQDPSNCAEFLQKPYYMMVYSCCETPAAHDGCVSAEFVVDTTGHLVEEREVFGLPDCVHDPERCVFIGEESALEVAAQAGLEPGLGPWETSFHWYAGDLNTYVWTVSTTLAQDASTGGAVGRVIVIDAASGEVLRWSSWERVP